MTALITDTSKTVASVEQEVKSILTEAGVPADQQHVGIKMIRSRTSKYSLSAGAPTGAFQIELWSLRSPGTRSSQSSASGRFRTKNDGTVPTEKIREYVIRQLAVTKMHNDAEATKRAATASTAATYDRIHAHAKAVLPSKYWSEYRGNSTFIANDTAIAGKVAINVGTMNLDESQAKALLDLVASF